MYITCIILDVISQVNKMQEQHSLESFVGQLPLLLLPLYLQPGTNKPVQMDFLQRACESPYQILSGKPWASLSIMVQDLPLAKVGP